MKCKCSNALKSNIDPSSKKVLSFCTVKQLIVVTREDNTLSELNVVKIPPVSNDPSRNARDVRNSFVSVSIHK